MKLDKVKASSRCLRSYSTEQKNKVLAHVAKALRDSKSKVLNANQKDLAGAKQKGLSPSMIDRLTLNESRINSMINAIEAVIQLKDPVGSQVEQYRESNGLLVTRERVPLGVIFMIYESRPNVTIDAASLAFKSGNAIILRGGSESLFTNRALLDVWRTALLAFPEIEYSVTMVEDQSHQTVSHLLKQDQWIDLVIPRGGEKLIRAVVEQSRIPVLKHYRGVCHCYIDESADMIQALNIIYDGKLSRPGVCNALETLLIHEKISDIFWKELDNLAVNNGLEIRACEKAFEKLTCSTRANDNDFGSEFLSKVIAVKQVQSIHEAIQHIERYGSQHTEVIVSKNQESIKKFKQQIDASVIMENCSSRFSDGGELGLGAEIGISTTKLHAYGPMGLEALTIARFVVMGEGQVRHENYANKHD